MLLSPVVWVFAYFFVLVTGGQVSMQAILPIAWLLLGTGVVFAGVRMARPLPLDDASATAASVTRVALLGFDPLSQPARLPRTWTEDPKVGERLDRFMRDAYMNSPTPSELPGSMTAATALSTSTPTSSSSASTTCSSKSRIRVWR